jgi:hypothetical protein
MADGENIPEGQTNGIAKDKGLYESLEQVPNIMKAVNELKDIAKANQEDKEKDAKRMTDFEKRLEEAVKQKEDDKEKKEGEDAEKQEEDKPKKTTYPYPDKSEKKVNKEGDNGMFDVKKFEESMNKTISDKFDQMQKSLSEGPQAQAPPAASEAPGPIQKFSAPPQGTGNPEAPESTISNTEWAAKVAEEYSNPEKYAEAVRGFKQRDHLEGLVNEFDTVYGEQRQKHLDILS